MPPDIPSPGYPVPGYPVPGYPSWHDSLPSGQNRLRWCELPVHVAENIEAWLGSPVKAAENQAYGFTPGLASRVWLADGRRYFVKAIGAGRTPQGLAAYRREADIAGRLPPSAPAPRLRWTYDDGQWVALVFDDAAGTPPSLPWRRAEFDRVMRSLVLLAEQMTPSPIQAPLVQADWAEDFRGWRTLAGDGGAPLEPLWAKNLGLLVSLEERWPDATGGDSLLHGDLRADNLILTGAGVVFVDWPNACIGAPWVDLVWMLPSTALHGAPDPEEVVAAHPLTRHVSPHAITAVVAAIAGFFVHGSLQPPVPGLPRLRAFQRAQALASLTWLSHRVPGWRA